MTEELTKKCSKCGRELPLSEFHIDKTCVGGVKNQCKSCLKEYHKIRYETHRSDILTHQHKYQKCVTKPSCLRVGGKGAQFELFTCEVCGKEFRRLKSKVDWIYEHCGYLPRFCSNDCKNEANRKSHKLKYEKEIERIKKEI